MNNKKLFAFLILGVFLLAFAPVVNATLKDYDTNTRTVHFDKSFLGIKTGNIADVQLLTPLNYKVGLGYQKVAEMEVTGFTDYDNFLTGMEFYDTKDDMKQFNRDYDLMKRGTEEYSVNDYTCENVLNINGTIQNECFISGSHLEERIIYTKLHRVDFKKNDELIIGLFTNVEEGDKVEWIASFTKNNVRVEEWAVWTADLNVDIISYYKLDNNLFTDSVGINNGTNVGTTNTSGIIIDGRSLDGSNDYIDANFQISDVSTDKTINYWVKTTSSSYAKGMGAYDGTDFITVGEFNAGGSNNVRFGLKSGGNTILRQATSSTIFNGNWHMLTFVQSGTSETDLLIYLDGSPMSMSTTTAGTLSPAGISEDIYLGSRNDNGVASTFFNGNLDEIGFWDRALTPTEISQLWNNSYGISYTNAFGANPIVVAIDPVDDYKSTISPIMQDFICYGEDANNFTEMEFYFDGVLEESNSSGFNNTNYTFQKTLTDGDYNWSCIGYDDEANTATFPTRNYSVDTTPFIELISPSPTEGEEILVDYITLNTTLTETYFENITFNLYNSTELIDSSTYTDTTRIHTFVPVIDGNYIVNATTWTSTGQSNTTIPVNFLVHTTIPQILISNPTGIVPFIKIGNSEQLNYSISELGENISHFNECWFEYNNTEVLNNISFTSNPTQWLFANNYANVTAITSNFGGTIINSEGIPAECSRVGNITIGHELAGGFDAIMYCLDISNNKLEISRVGTIAPDTVNITTMVKRPLNCSATNENFEYVLDVNNLCVHAIDEFGLHSENTTSWDYDILELETNFNNVSLEAASETFEYIFKSPFNVIATQFNYNGTAYSANSFSNGTDQYRLTSTIQLPNVEVDTNFTFNFAIQTDNNGVIQSTQFNQTVTSLNVDNCTLYNNSFVTSSLFDEKNLFNITGNVEVSFKLFNPSDLSIISEFFNGYTNVHTFQACSNIDVSQLDLLYDLEMRYYQNLTESTFNYVPEFYHIQKASTSTLPQLIDLFDLNQNQSTEFTIFYRDNSYVSRANVLFQILREYVSEGIFRTVEIPISSSEGSAIAHFDLNNFKYKIIVTENGEVLNIFDNPAITCESEISGLCTLNLKGEKSVPLSQGVSELNDFVYSATQDNETIEITFSVPTGSSKSVNVKMVQSSPFSDDIELCDTTVLSSAGSISCDTVATIGDGTVVIVVTADNVTEAFLQALVEENLNDSFQFDNYFIGALLLVLLMGMGISSPQIMVWIGVFGLIVLGALFLLNTSSIGLVVGAITWFITAAVIITVKINKRVEA